MARPQTIMNMEKLFSYGTLRQENVQIETFGRKLMGSPDTLLRYVIGEVRIKDPDIVQKSGKEIHPILKHTGNPEDKVEGKVFEITEKELRQADEYEVDEYKRVSGDFLSGCNAWVYVESDD